MLDQKVCKNILQVSEAYNGLQQPDITVFSFSLLSSGGENKKDQIY